MKTMRAVVFQGRNRIAVEDVPRPTPRAGEAVIRVTTTTICGTDVHIVRGEYPVKPGLVIGHEPVGVIEELGPGLETLYSVGQRVIVGAITPCGQCFYCLNGSQVRAGDGRSPNRTEVFSFATRLTRLTPALAAASPVTMLAKAGEAAPDWSGGTRIGAALKEFNDRYGARGMARGAVVLIISDGWETGEPELLGVQMARLSRIAHRIVWANPRTQSSRYSPEVGGMAAAWPYCDAVVSAHNLDALDDLLAALRAR